MNSSKLTIEHLRRRAIVYIRQSTPNQVQENLESQRRQYALADLAREMRFDTIEVIDDDLGRSGSGSVDRPGFQRLFAELATRDVGAVFCLEASRLARNGREWHALLDLCGMVQAVIVDPEGVYDPRNSNDRLLLGLKGTLSEYELTLLRQRAHTAIRAKAARGELRFFLPVGLCWTPDSRIEIHPDARIREAVRLVYQKYAELGSIRRVLLWFHNENLTLPVRWRGYDSDSEVEWNKPVQSTIHRTLTSPLYAGAYAWGRTTLKASSGSKRGNWELKQLAQWEVLLIDHHPGYISWDEYLRILETMKENAHSNPWSPRKAGRGGRALLSGLFRCQRCGRRLRVHYTGGGNPRYVCEGTLRQDGQSCIAFAGVNADEVISEEVLKIVEQPALEAALIAADSAAAQYNNELHLLELELEQMRYRARLAERRYERVDPDNRLVAPELERRWNNALAEVLDAKRRLNQRRKTIAVPPDRDILLRLAATLPEVWNDEQTDSRLKQRIVRTLIDEILVDVDEDAGLVLMVIRWFGGRHSEVRAKRRRQNKHRLTTSTTALDIVRRMGAYYSEQQIAATLNRLGLKTGKGDSWNTVRLRGFRHAHGLTDAVLAAAADAEPAVTLVEAARRLNTSTTTVRKIIDQGILRAEQVVPFAPWRIAIAALTDPAAVRAVASIQVGRRPRRRKSIDQNRTIPGL